MISERPKRKLIRKILVVGNPLVGRVYRQCGLDYESMKHFFLFYPRYAAQRNLLLTSAGRILGETWSSVMLGKLISYCSALIKSVNYDINYTLFRKARLLSLILITFRWPPFDCLITHF